MRNRTDAELIDESRRVHQAASDLDIPKALKSTDLVANAKKLEEETAKSQRLAAEKAQSTAAKRRHRAALNAQVKNIRNAVKGIYGDDSKEFELVGGRRISTRKRPVRKAKVAKVG